MVLTPVWALAIAPALAVMAGPPTVAVEAPDSARVAELRGDLAGTRWIRMTYSGCRVELMRPQVSEDGIGFARAKGFPAARPALVVIGHWDSVPLPPNPVPWAGIARIERRDPRWGWGAPLGATLGFWGGFALAVPVSWAVATATQSWEAGTVALVTIGFGGVALGSFAMGHDAHWVEAYPARDERHPRPAPARRR